MKRSRSVKLVAMGTGLLLVAACDEAKVDTALFESVKQCTGLGFTAQECETNYKAAQSTHINAAPKYTKREECEADFGAEKCEVAPQRTAGGGSIFMPLMAGYMMGSLLGGGRRGIAQPLYKSANDRSTFRTADNKNVGKTVGRTQVAKSATRAPTAKTRTVSRGGFGAGARSPMRRSFGG
jgi:uncharacterized protein YgiB involved in biofilm formation